MTLTKVLEMLYGKVASGYLQATYIENGKCRSKCFQIDQLSEMESFIRKYGKSCNTYIDINPRNREMEYYERGSRDDISTVVGAYQDYDIKGIVPNFQTQDYMKLICESRKAGAKDDIY